TECGKSIDTVHLHHVDLVTRHRFHHSCGTIVSLSDYHAALRPLTCQRVWQPCFSIASMKGSSRDFPLKQDQCRKNENSESYCSSRSTAGRDWRARVPVVSDVSLRLVGATNDG